MEAFEYKAPGSLSEAIALLADPACASKVLAGGTDLLIQLRAGVRGAGRIIDVKRIPELQSLAVSPGQGLRIGAAVPCFRLVEDPVVSKVYPGLTEAAALIGSTQIQSRATLVGNLCNGSPAADTTPALLALGAAARVMGPGGERTVPVEELLVGPGKVALRAGELVAELTLPWPSPGSADAYQRFTPRSEMDIAVVGVGATLQLEGDRCTAARIALGAVGPKCVLANEAAAALVGSRFGDEPDESALQRASEAARQIATPVTDHRGTAELRRHLVGVLLQRVVVEAARRARQSSVTRN